MGEPLGTGSTLKGVRHLVLSLRLILRITRSDNDLAIAAKIHEHAVGFHHLPGAKGRRAHLSPRSTACSVAGWTLNHVIPRVIFYKRIYFAINMKKIVAIAARRQRNPHGR